MRRKLELIVSGGGVKRWHVQRTLKEQSVAEHSFGVAWLVWFITDGRASVNLIMHALAHDVAEYITGDVPAPAKRSMGISHLFDIEEEAVWADHGLYLPNLTKEELRTLKFADVCELLLFCVREISLGNKNMVEVYSRGVGYLLQHSPWNDLEAKLMTVIGERYGQACK